MHDSTVNNIIHNLPLNNASLTRAGCSSIANIFTIRYKIEIIFLVIGAQFKTTSLSKLRFSGEFCHKKTCCCSVPVFKIT